MTIKDTALLHHWLISMRGGEKVLEQIALIFSDAPIHTLVAYPPSLNTSLRYRRIHTTPLQWIGGRHFYREFMPFFPFLVPLLRVGSPGGLVISSDASVIKGATIHPKARHICYCHSPPRYLWDRQSDYINQTGLIGGLKNLIFRLSVRHVRQFDRRAAEKVNLFVANSRFVQERIKSFYGRDSVVVYPPVDVDAFDPTRRREDFFLIASELVSYKKVDLAVRAFQNFTHPLLIIGDGPERGTIERLATPNIRFLGRQPFAVLKDHLERCRAFLYPQVEDFGITAVEAQAAGAPVIALGLGGATETVIDGRTGFFFQEQSAKGLAEAVKSFLQQNPRINPEVTHENAKQFSTPRFQTSFKNVLAEFLSKSSQR